MEQKTPKQLIVEVNELGDKLKLVEEKIVSKQDEAETLKKNNAKLLGLHIGKQRMPPSVGIQREQIKTIDIEITELEYLKEDLTKQIHEKRKDLGMANLAQRVIGFKESNQQYFQLFGKVEKALFEVNIQVGELLNRMKEGVHPLSRLRDLYIDLNQNKINLDIFDLDLKKLAGNYVTTIDRLKELDELKIAAEEIQFQTRSYFNQVTEVLKNKSSRSFPTRSLPKRSSPPLTEEERRRSFFQEAVRSDDLKTGKGGFQPVILEPVKYVQDKAVRIPGAKPKESPPDFCQDEFEKEADSGIAEDPALEKAISDGIIDEQIKKIQP